MTLLDVETTDKSRRSIAPDPSLAPLKARLPLLQAAYMWLGVLGGVFFATRLLLGSQGTLLDDEIGHVLISRDAWLDPKLILDVWGRTANTLVFMPAAPFGLTAARFEALALATVAVLLTYRLGRHLGADMAWAIPLFVFFQPWFAQTSFQALTEIPFTLLTVLGWCLLLEGHALVAGLAIGLLPMVRNEGILLLGVWVAMLAFRRQWLGAVAAIVPLIVYNAVAFLTTGAVPASIYFTPQPSALYGSGGWLHYAAPLLDGIGKPVAVLAILGIPAMLRRPERRLFAAWNLIYIAMHVVFFRFGLFASGGYGVFLLPTAPLFAIMAAFGLAVLVNGLRALPLPRQAEWAAVATMMLAVTWLSIRAGLEAYPIPRDSAYQAPLEQAADWLRDEGLDRGPVRAAHVWFYCLLPLQIPPSPALWLTPPPVSHDALPPGTVLVWDSKYSDLAGWKLTDLSATGEQWQPLEEFGGGAVRIFRKT